MDTKHHNYIASETFSNSEYENMEFYNGLKIGKELSVQVTGKAKTGAVWLKKGERNALLNLDVKAESDYVIIPVKLVVETDSAMKPADDFRCWPPPFFIVSISFIQVSMLIFIKCLAI